MAQPQIKTSPTSSNPAQKKMTPDEFLEWQRKQDQLYELVDGVPVIPAKMMTGTSRNHDRVTVNALLSLGNQLKGQPCQPCTDDIAVKIPDANYRRPDLLVDCGESGPKEMFAIEPRLVIEVLSPSNSRMDFLRKLEEYKTVPPLRAILLVATSHPKTTLYTREDGNTPWKVSYHDGLETELSFPGLDVKLPLKDLYDRVEFDET